MSADVVIIGGGVIGLSLAWELAGEGRSVTVLDQQQVGKEASWAGAGILPPGHLPGARTPFDRLRAMSVELWSDWSSRLLSQTGIENGYQQCGGLTISMGAESSEPHRVAWRAEGVEVEELDGTGLQRFEPELSSQIIAGIRLPGLAQVRNPWHLNALASACRQRGVEIRVDQPVNQIEQVGGKISAVLTPVGRVIADQFCFTAGAWTGQLLSQIGCPLPIIPVRGQMLLYRTSPPLIQHIIEVGKRYLVPRQDGRLLVGSTEEDVGFVKENTEQGIAGLKLFAETLVPSLKRATLEKTWAGLRPASQTGTPFLGRIPDTENTFVAAGHFRAGLQTSPATAISMRQLMCGQKTDLDLSPFSPDLSQAEMSS